MNRKSMFVFGILLSFASISMAQQMQNEHKKNRNKPQLALGSATIQGKGVKLEQPKAELKMFSVVEENGNNTKPKAKVGEPQLAPYSIEANPK